MTMMIPIFALLGASDIATGILFSAKAALQICSSPIMASYVDRHQKAMIMSGVVLQVISILVFYVVKFDYGMWFCARALSGIASAAIMSAGMAHLKSKHSDNDERGTVMGIATTGIVTGVCLGPMFGGVLYDFNPRLPFIMLASVEMVLLIALAIFLPATMAKTAAENAEADSVSTRAMLSDDMILKPLAGLAVANACISCLESTVSKYFMSTFGMNPGGVGTFYLWNAAASCLMSGFAGPIGNYFGRKNAVMAGLVMQGVFMMVGPKDSLIVEVVSFVGVGLGMGCIDGTMPALLGEVADARFNGSGKVYVLANVAVQVGFVLGPVLGNVIRQFCGFQVCCITAGMLVVLYTGLFSSMPKLQAVGVPLLAH